MTAGFAGKVVVVTGGASGIGRALAEAFRAEGAKPVIADVEADAVTAVAAEVGAHGVVTDVSNARSVRALADEVLDRYGRVDVLCNNAGVSSTGRLGDATLADWRWVLDVNLMGVVHGVRTFLPELERNPDGGHIVNTTSMLAFAPRADYGVYTTSKYAVLGLTESLRADLEQSGSRVNVSALCPGLVRTRIADAGRNRQARYGAPASPAPEQLDDVAAHFVDPGEVAAQALRAIRRGAFWIVTHPQMFDDAIRRFDEIRASLPPEG